MLRKFCSRRTGLQSLDTGQKAMVACETSVFRSAIASIVGSVCTLVGRPQQIWTPLWDGSEKQFRSSGRAAAPRRS